MSQKIVLKELMIMLYFTGAGAIPSVDKDGIMVIEAMSDS